MARSAIPAVRRPAHARRGRQRAHQHPGALRGLRDAPRGGPDGGPDHGAGLRLGGVISGEHGIGLTKIRYLEHEKLEAFLNYKLKVDPKERFNRGKLMPGSGLDGAYTPSLRLVQQEAIILEETSSGR